MAPGLLGSKTPGIFRAVERATDLPPHCMSSRKVCEVTFQRQPATPAGHGRRAKIVLGCIHAGQVVTAHIAVGTVTIELGDRDKVGEATPRAPRGP